MKTPWYRSKNLWAIFIAIVAIFLAYHWYEPTTKRPLIPVSVSAVIVRDIVPSVEAVGSIATENSVNIQSQISGQITKIPAQPGQEVKAGDLLFVIDPRPFQAQVDQATATLLKDKAAADNAKDDLARYVKLAKKGYISKELYEQTKSNADSAKALVEADKAALANAQVQLSYTQIRAPISGRLSDINPNEGDLTTANSTPPLTTINQFSPIDAAFSVPTASLPSILAAQKASPLTVTAIPDVDKSLHAQGKLYFINNQIDSTTGTINMKAAFANTDEKLWPGEFVHVYLNLPTIPHALLVPTIALQQDQQQQYYAYVVDQKNHARRKSVNVGIVQGDLTQIVSGLTANDKVITQGQFQITDGSQVKIN
ncbi:MAG: efflux transporter, family, subunit [Gammaproteobacteria bacterium]|nr:efflux transporter, family, subunit [Gammaproteobacteria bacterium]